jgi:hypothetical protein
MSSQVVKLKRTAVEGKVPNTSNIELGELAINTYDGRIFFEKDNGTPTIQQVVTTNSQTTGSLNILGDVTASYFVGDGSQLTNLPNSDVSQVATVTSSFDNQSSIVVTHNFGSKNVFISVYDNSDSQIIPQSVVLTNNNTVTVGLSGNHSGYVVVGKGGHLVSGTFVQEVSEVATVTASFDNQSSINVSHNFNSRNVIVSIYDSNYSQLIPETLTLTDENSVDIVLSGNHSGHVVVAKGGHFVSGSVTTIANFTELTNKPSGLVSGSSQLTSSYDTRYALSGSVGGGNGTSDFTQLINVPSGLVSGSSQVISILNSVNTYTASQSTSSLATTGSNTFVGTQTYSGSIIPATDNTYDLGSPTNQFRDLYLSSASLYIDGTRVLGSTAQELTITTDVGQSIKILEAGSDSIILQSTDGDIELKSSGGGDILLDPTAGLISVKGTLQIQDGNRITSSGGNSIQFGNDLGITGSISTTGNINGINLTSFSSSLSTQIKSIQSSTSSTEERWTMFFTYTSSNDTTNTTQNSRLTSLETKSGSVDSSISSINSFTSSNGNTSLNAATASYATTGSNTFFGTQTFSGSVYIANDLVVQGTSSLQNITASAVSIGTNIVNLNTATPAVRYAGLVVVDSGSVGGSGSFLYDSVQDEFIFVHRGNGTNVTSSHFVLGPETYDDLGNEIYLTNNRIPKGSGKEHLNDSNITDNGTLITLGSNTVVNGTLVASGTTLVSSSAQVVGILSSLNTYTGSNDTTNTAQNSRLDQLSTASGSAITRLTALEAETLNLELYTASNDTTNTTQTSRLNQLSTYTGSNDTTNTAQNSRLTTIESATGSYETRGRGIVSGSSQITFSGISSLPTLVSGSSQITLSSTTGYSSVINQAVLTSSSPTFANVTATSFVLGNGQFLRGTRTSGGLVINLLGIESGTDRTMMTITGDYVIQNGSNTALLTMTTSGNSTFAGNVLPASNNAQDLGSAAVAWRNIYTNDLHLSNEGKPEGNDVDGTTGNWTIQEGTEHLYIINNKTGKKFKFSLEEIQ